MNPPEQLRSSRLLLRIPEMTDASLLERIYSNSEVTAFLDPPFPTTEAKSNESLVTKRTDWIFESLERRWTIERSEDSQAIGFIMISFRDELVELGYVLERGAWSQGFATEACRSVLGWTDTEPDLHAVFAPVDPGNAASIRLLDRLGFSQCRDESALKQYLESFSSLARRVVLCRAKSDPNGRSSMATL